MAGKSFEPIWSKYLSYFHPKLTQKKEKFKLNSFEQGVPRKWSRVFMGERSPREDEGSHKRQLVAAVEKGYQKITL